ncbi:MAG TPA: DUF4233 domain-containing protein [Jiangellaceae bacterium]|nr:DUF4233 domain-containing protein [Jiangellaceae bacterium]
MSRVAAALLSLEAVVIVLAIPVAVAVTDVVPAVAVPAGLAVGLACVVAAALVRRSKAGYILGSVLQVLAVASGFVVPAMFFLGGLFAVLWFVLLRIGPEVDRARAAGNGESGS